MSRSNSGKELFIAVIKSLQEIYEDVANETYMKSKKEASSLFNVLSSWIDVDLFKKYKLEEIAHSVQGVLFSYFWRAASWIIYEIVTGHYFEALRDLRFLFEASLLALQYDRLIDNRLYEKWGYLGRFELKAEIVELAEKLRNKVKSLKSTSPEELKHVIEDEVGAFVSESSIDQQEKEWYIKAYSDILSQPMFYWSIYKIISQFVRKWNLEEYESDLKRAWSVLSLYTHFSRKFFEWVLESGPHELFIEHYNEHLFRTCYSIFITTIDVFFSTLLVRYPKLQNSLREIIRDLEIKLNVELKITKRILEALS